MSSDLLASYSGILLTLIFSYVPGLNEKYAGLSDTYKKLIMLGMLALVSLGVVGLACSGFGADFGVDVACDKNGFVAVIKAFVFALVANQAAYKLSPETSAVREAKYYSLG